MQKLHTVEGESAKLKLSNSSCLRMFVHFADIRKIKGHMILHWVFKGWMCGIYDVLEPVSDQSWACARILQFHSWCVPCVLNVGDTYPPWLPLLLFNVMRLEIIAPDIMLMIINRRKWNAGRSRYPSHADKINGQNLIGANENQSNKYGKWGSGRRFWGFKLFAHTILGGENFRVEGILRVCKSTNGFHNYFVTEEMITFGLLGTVTSSREAP